MSKILNLEEKSNLISKKLSLLLESLSSSLSKEKTENALKEGFQYIKEIENIIKIAEKSSKQNDINLYLIQGELIKNKEKLENFQKAYILNKSNQLIDSLSTNNLTMNENYMESNVNKDEFDTDDNYIIEENDDESYGKNFIDEYFKENKNLNEFTESYIYNDNYVFRTKRLLFKIYLKIYNAKKEISPKVKYLILFLNKLNFIFNKRLILLFILMISLIFCIIRLYLSIINYVK